jgi:hypothetical protein
VAADPRSDLYQGYDGRLTLSWPDDLYIVAPAATLKRIRGAIDRALTRGIGYTSKADCRNPQVIIIPMEPICE